MNNPSSSLNLETISESGKPPVSRILTASDARTISDAILEANADRSRINGNVRRMFDGAPPFKPSALKAEGQGWRTNFNGMEGDALSSAALVPIYDLFAGAKFYASVQLKNDSPSEREYVSGVATEEFDWLMKSYDGFDFNMQRMGTDMIRYGKGFLAFPDASSWFFKCVPQYRVFVPDGTEAFQGALELLVIRQQYKVHELWEYIKDKTLASKSGWDSSEVSKAIGRAMPETSSNMDASYDYEWLQQRIKDHELSEGMRMPTIPVRHILVREFSGKISHFIIEENRNSNKRDKSDGDFLFKRLDRFDDFGQYIQTFFFETLDGSWNGAIGLGHRIFPIVSLKDRARCAAVDLMFLRTGVNMQAKNASATQTACLIRRGPINIIPPGFDVQQSTILGDIESPMVMDRLLDNLLTSNTGIYRTRQERTQGNPRTAKEVELQYQSQAILSNSAVNRFYSGLDRLYTEIWRRVIADLPNWNESSRKLVMEFRDRCKKRNVTLEQLRKVNCVRAYRNAGNGSFYLRQQAIAQTMPLFGMLPESGKQNFVDFALASINGQSMADLFNPKGERDVLPDDHTATAMLENNALKNGSPVQWTPTQNDVEHLQAHFLAATQEMQSFQNGRTEPAQIVGFLDAIGAHSAEHLKNLGKNPARQNEFKTLADQWKQLATIRDKVADQAAKMAQQKQQQMAAMMQARQVQSGQDPDTMIKTAVAQHDMQLKQVKTDSALEQKRAKTEQDMALKDARTAADIRRKNTMMNAGKKTST